VIAFEPHPRLFEILGWNVESARQRFAIASTELHNQALGARAAPGRLLVPAGFDANDGLARMVADGVHDDAIAVEVNTLDGVLGTRPVSVLKMDVEGHEIAVLEGSREALAAARIRHVLFEDHDIRTSRVAALLRTYGYSVQALGWSFDRLRLQPIDATWRPPVHDAASFIASLDAGLLNRRIAGGGWKVLSGRFGRQRLRHQRSSAARGNRAQV
jgi:FkbM family methyltransferase